MMSVYSRALPPIEQKLLSQSSDFDALIRQRQQQGPTSRYPPHDRPSPVSATLNRQNMIVSSRATLSAANVVPGPITSMSSRKRPAAWARGAFEISSGVSGKRGEEGAGGRVVDGFVVPFTVAAKRDAECTRKKDAPCRLVAWLS